MLLGSAFANIGALASVLISQRVGDGVGVGPGGLGVGSTLTIVGRMVAGEGDGAGVGDGAGLMPYRLKVVVKFKLPEIYVLGALFPCKYE